MMQEDPFPAADKILCDIEAILKKDPKLQEFDIIPVTENQNKSPVIHVEHCLGLELWSVRHVYCYAYHRLMDIRQHQGKKEDPSILSRLLTGCLLINPDISSFWNMRREMVQAGSLNIHSELHFTAVVLSRKPKCPEAFSYRKWIIKRILVGSANTEELLREELLVTQFAADRYPNNYNAWNHRMWCMNCLSPLASDPLGAHISEWKSSERWISTHVSDHSGMQYRQFVLRKLFSLFASVGGEQVKSCLLHCFCHLQEGDYFVIKDSDDSYSPVKFLILDLHLNTDLILSFEGHEALWCHRRFLLTVLKEMICRNSSVALPNSTSNKCHLDYLFYMKNEQRNSSEINAVFCCPKEITVEQNNNNNGVPLFTILDEYSHMNSDGMPLQKDLKLSENTDEIEHLLTSALVTQEENLIKRCSNDNFHQRRLSMRHSIWLNKVLKISVNQPDD